MPGLELTNVGKAFDNAFAIRDVSLNVGPGELACLLGPSGCGKIKSPLCWGADMGCAV